MWAALCAEFEAAKEEEHQAWASVLAKFAAVAQGGQENPPIADLDLWDEARARLDDVEKRMAAFIRECSTVT